MDIDGVIVLSQYVDKTPISYFIISAIATALIACVAVGIGTITIYAFKEKEYGYKSFCVLFSILLIVFAFFVKIGLNETIEYFNDIGNMVYTVEIQNKYAYVEVCEKYEILENIIDDIYLVKEK